MDLNLVGVGGEASVEKVTQEETERGITVTEVVDGDSSFCGKEDRERGVEEEEKEIRKAEGESSSGKAVVSKRASTRTWSLLATEKIEKLKEEVYEWEYDRKKRRKSESRERKSKIVESEDTGLGGEENIEGQSAKRRPGRKRKVVKSEDTGLRVEDKGEEKNVEGQRVKRRPGRKRKIVKSEDTGLGVEAEGEEKNVEGQRVKRRPGRKRKVVKSEDTGLGVEVEGEEKNVEGQRVKRRPGRKKKAVKSEETGLVGGEAEGEEKNVEEERLQRTLRRTERKNKKSEGTGLQAEEKNVEGQCTRRRRGRKSLAELAEQQVENGGDGRDVFVTVRDDQDNKVEPIGCKENGKKNERNTCHQCKRNDKGKVVWCTKCWCKRYCLVCISRW